MMSFLDAIACVISRTTHALDVITSISRYDRRSNLLHFFRIIRDFYVEGGQKSQYFNYVAVFILLLILEVMVSSP